MKSTPESKKENGSGQHSSGKRQQANNQPSGLGRPEPRINSQTRIYPKLEVGAANDPAEREADLAAEQVLRGGKVITGNGGAPADQPGALRMKANSAAQGGITAPTSVESKINSKRGKGGALPQPLQQKLSHTFGTDFSGVSVHTDGASHGMNAELGAKAFTQGSDMFFGKGQYAPGTPEGDRLIAHEAAHVVQGGTAIRRSPLAGIFGIAGLEAVEAATLGIGVIQTAQSVLTQSGNIEINAESANRIIEGEPIPVEQKEYRKYIFWCNDPGYWPFGGPWANLIFKWKGSPYGEIIDAHVELDFANSNSFDSSSLKFNLDYISTETDLNVVPAYLANDPRQWPLRFRYQGTFNPAGIGSYDFIGEFLINAFGAYKNTRHEVYDRSFISTFQRSPGSYVKSNEPTSFGDPVPDLLPFQKEILKDRLPNDQYYKELLEIKSENPSKSKR